MPTPNLRQISVSLSPELVSLVDVATPTHRSRSVVVAEALQLWLEARDIDPPGDWKDRWTVSGNEPSQEEKSRLAFDED
jgi:Arc/MetJ-type ribon-helix-helix transcriptional regulator